MAYLIWDLMFTIHMSNYFYSTKGGGACAPAQGTAPSGSLWAKSTGAHRGADAHRCAGSLPASRLARKLISCRMYGFASMVTCPGHRAGGRVWQGPRRSKCAGSCGRRDVKQYNQARRISVMHFEIRLRQLWLFQSA